MEDLRFWSIREVGKLHDTSRLAGTHLHALRQEVDSLKARLDTKAEAAAVVFEMGWLRGDVGEEFRKTRLEIEGTFRELTAQAQSAFQQVGVVEANLQAHVQHGFSGAVLALQTLDAQTKVRMDQLEAQIAMAAAPPPTPAPEFARRHVASAPALNLKADLSGCSAGPFACGCGGGANQAKDAGLEPVSEAGGAPSPPKGPLGPHTRTGPQQR